MTDTLAGVEAEPKKPAGSLRKTILWVIIGAVGLSALVSILWVMLGDRIGSLAGAAFGTIALVTLFSVFSLIEVDAGEKRAQWVTVTRIGTLALTLLIGVYFLWVKAAPVVAGDYEYMSDYASAADGWARFSLFVFLLIPVTQLAMLHLSLTARRLPKYDAGARGVAVASIAATCLVALLIVIQIVFYTDLFDDLYWRVLASMAIIASVLTILPPVIHAIKHPKPKVVAPPVQPQQYAQPYPPQGYPQPYPPQYGYPQQPQTPPAIPPFSPPQQ